MPYSRPDALVSTDWLAQHLTAPDVRVVDATSYLPWEDGDARAEYADRHIPGAVFFDLDEIADTDSQLPHMLPAPEKFASRVRKLGLGDGNRIVVYDAHGIRSAPRVWWTFRVFGHKDIAVLDGGLPRWIAEGHPTEDLPPVPRDRHFTARVDRTMVRDLSQIRDNLTAQREQVVDARAVARFAGTAEEPWPGRRAGHIPGSLNLPFTDLIDPDSGMMKRDDGLRAVFERAGVDLSRPIVTTCGSGVTAAILALGLHLTGARDVALYDGSWAEWGRPGDTPVATSAD